MGRRWPTHLDSNRKFAGKIRIFEKNAGMKMVDSRFLQNPIVFQKNGGTPAKKISLWKRFVIWYGSCWLAIFGKFPKLMPFLIHKTFRRDSQLTDLEKD